MLFKSSRLPGGKTIGQRYLRSSLLAAALLGAAAHSQAQITYEVVPADHSLVRDTTTGFSSSGVVWQRCAYGMAWNEALATCTGTALDISGADAAKGANKAAMNGFTDWYVPSLNELGSMIKLNVPVGTAKIYPEFPATPTDKVFLSSLSVGGMVLTGVNFADGSAPVSIFRTGYVRLARLGPTAVSVKVTSNSNGTVDPAEQKSSTSGSVQFSATPDLGYRVGSHRGDTCTPGRDSVAGPPFYQSGRVGTKDCNITVTFERDPNVWLISSATVPADQSGGTIVCPTSANSNQIAACIASPAPGWSTKSISGCSGIATREGINNYDTGPATADCSVTATFGPTYAFQITPSTDGAIACTNSATNVPINNGDVLVIGTPVQCEATPASGKLLAAWAADCAGPNATTAGNMCTFAAINAPTTVAAQYAQIDKSFTRTTVPTSGTGGTAIASFTGGGAACRFDNSATGFVAAPATLPKDQVLPQGMFEFKLIDCDTTPVAVSIEWPNAVQGLSKYGKAAKDATESSYFVPDNLQISGKVSQFTVADGQKGDEDWTVNREIVDPVMPTEAKVIPPVTVATPVPTLIEWALALLRLMAKATGAVLVRRRDLKG